MKERRRETREEKIKMGKDLDGLTEDERKALRGSKFAPLPPPPPNTSLKTQPRLAHPGGPIATNKAAALAKFLKRKLQEPDGLASINPALIERAVKNAKDAVNASGSSSSGNVIRHVSSFGDSENLQDTDEEITEKTKDKASKVKKLKGQKLKKKKKKQNQ